MAAKQPTITWRKPAPRDLRNPTVIGHVAGVPDRQGKPYECRFQLVRIEGGSWKVNLAVRKGVYNPSSRHALVSEGDIIPAPDRVMRTQSLWRHLFAYDKRQDGPYEPGDIIDMVEHAGSMQPGQGHRLAIIHRDKNLHSNDISTEHRVVVLHAGPQQYALSALTNRHRMTEFDKLRLEVAMHFNYHVATGRNAKAVVLPDTEDTLQLLGELQQQGLWRQIPANALVEMRLNDHPHAGAINTRPAPAWRGTFFRFKSCRKRNCDFPLSKD